MFAGFCYYAYYKFVRYEEAPPPKANADQLTELPDGLLPERPRAAFRTEDDAEMRDYNAYLAELAKADANNDDRTSK
jgi:DNA-binding transcriptional regulator of glucitol operon